jgi:hypothetical protein
MDAGKLIVDGTITASKIGANAVTANAIQANAITAVKIAANAITANHISANSITSNKLEANLILTTKIVAGQVDGTYAEMSPQGFRVYADSPEVGAPSTEAVRLGVAGTDDYFAITKADGSYAATISQDGVGSFKTLTATDISFKGMDLAQLLWNLPKGHVGSAYRTTDAVYNAIAGQGRQPYLRYDLEVEEGRLYKVSTSAIRMGLTTGGIGRAHVHFAVDRAANEYDTILTYADVFREGESVVLNELYTPQTGSFVNGRKRLASFLISFVADAGESGIRASTNVPVRLLVEDVGPLINTYSGVFLNGANQTPPPPQLVTYVRQYNCNNSMNYTGSNTQYNYDTGRMYQGLSPAGQGNLKSIGLFPDMTGDLAGATINYMRVYFYFDHWYYNSGGTARLGVHGHTAIPGTFGWGGGGWIGDSAGWPKPGDRWVDIPSAHWNGFKTGAYRGIALEGDGTYGTYGYARRPVLEISFTK